jgi:hypothetical protein
MDARHMEKYFPNTNEPTVFVRISIEHDSHRTRLVVGKGSPQWSENLTLDVNKGNEPIKVELFV